VNQEGCREVIGHAAACPSISNMESFLPVAGSWVLTLDGWGSEKGGKSSDCSRSP
jgi:hypothetical protein